jgi:integrase
VKIPSYRKHSTRDLGFAEYCGKRKYFKGRYNSRQSKAEYAAWLRDVVGLADAVGQVPAACTVTELVERFLDEAVVYYAGNQEYTQFRTACSPLTYLFGPTLAEDFGPLALKSVRDLMISGEWSSPARPWARKYVNHQINRVRRVFKWGVANELVPASVHHALATVRGLAKGRTKAKETEPVGPAPERAVDAVLRVATPHVAAMIRLQRLTGMRSDNLCSMRLADINGTPDVWIYLPPQHKAAWLGKSLAIFLGPQCQEILRPFLDRPANAYLFSPLESEAWRNDKRRSERKSKVQPSQESRKPKPYPKRPRRDHYDPDSYRKAINYAIAKVNRRIARLNERIAAKNESRPAEQQRRLIPPIPHWHPHQLRHSIGTLVRTKYGIEGAQVYLGHANADVTQVYAERDLALARKIAQELG